MVDVGNKLIGQFADALSAQLGEGAAEPAPAANSNGAAGPAKTTAKTTAAAAKSPNRRQGNRDRGRADLSPAKTAAKAAPAKMAEPEPAPEPAKAPEPAVPEEAKMAEPVVAASAEPAAAAPASAEPPAAEPTKVAPAKAAPRTFAPQDVEPIDLMPRPVPRSSSGSLRSPRSGPSYWRSSRWRSAAATTRRISSPRRWRTRDGHWVGSDVAP